MIRSSLIANIVIDGGYFIEGFLGLKLFPSAQANERMRRYEGQIQALLCRIYGRFSAAQLLLEIWRQWPKTVTIKPRTPPSTTSMGMPAERTSAVCNADTVPDSYPKGTLRGQPAPTPPKDSLEDRTVGSGTGSDVEMYFDPFALADPTQCPLAPGRGSDEVLLHELVHASNFLSGTYAGSMAAPAGYKTLDEFTAVLITNLYSSETGRRLRKGADDHALLESPETDPQVFFTRYRDYIFAANRLHPVLINELKKGTGIAFNPLVYL